MKGRGVFFDLGEAGEGFVEAVVGGVIVDGGDFADEADAVAGGAEEFVIEAGGEGDGFAGGEGDGGGWGELSEDAVDGDADGGEGELSIGGGVVELADEEAGTAVDDVLGFLEVEVPGGDLVFADDEEFFGVDFLIGGVGGFAVAEGEEEEAEGFEVAAAEVSDIPAEGAGANFMGFGSDVFPMVGGPEGEGWEVEVVLGDEADGVGEVVVDLGAFHGGLLGGEGSGIRGQMGETSEVRGTGYGVCLMRA